MKFSEFCRFKNSQWEATENADRYKYFLYGGRRGVLKSYWLRWYGLRRLLMFGAQGFRNVKVMLACEDFPTLTDRQISKIQTEFPRELGEIKTTRIDGFCFHLRPEFGGGKLAFRSLDDPQKFRGSEWAGILIDELTQNEEFIDRELSLFDVLRGSLRWPGINQTFFAATSNPDGPGQLWVRKLFVEKNPPDYLLPEKEKFCYQRGVVEDKILLPDSYWQMLDTLSPKLREAWVDANWYVTFEGLVFPEFTELNLTDEEPEKTLPVECSIDDGYEDPRSILFIQRKGIYYFIFDEIYENHRLAEYHITEAKKRLATHGFKNFRMAVTSNEDAELRAQLSRNGIASEIGSHDVIEGINRMRRQIVDSQGVRLIKVHRRCRNLISEFTERYKYPSKKKVLSTEKPQDGNDHAIEALRKWLWVRTNRGVGISFPERERVMVRSSGFQRDRTRTNGLHVDKNDLRSVHKLVIF